MASEDITLTILHRSQTYTVSLDPSATLQSLQEELATITSVPSHLQKLLYKGKKKSEQDAPLNEAGITNGMKITLLGNPESTIGDLLEAERQQQRKEEILRARAAGPKPKVCLTQLPYIRPVLTHPKVRSTGPAKSFSTYRFHRIEPLKHLPDPSQAERLLKRLAEDPAIVHIMQEHKFSVGLLTELAPHEHPELLGLNKNAGEAILLRLRTNAMDGFRLYSEVRRVLCHELTHNVWGDHDDNVSLPISVP